MKSYTVTKIIDGVSTFKSVYLRDNNGNQIYRKVRRDSKGLFVINRGMKGYLKKQVIPSICKGVNYLLIIRRVDYYVKNDA